MTYRILAVVFCCVFVVSLAHAREEPSAFTMTPLRFSQQAERKLLRGEEYSVSFDRNGIKLAGEYRLIRGGSFQWFRLPEETWEDRMMKFKSMGFNALDIYIPWNLVEPSEGEFNFEQPSLRRFLQLAQRNGIFVVIRPGPYITNEMDGGGLPAWLSKRSTKASYEADGKANLRSHDPDFIEPVRRYWEALNTVIQPFTADNGGPIIMYTVENEYNWFERFHAYDKLFRLNGKPERPLTQALPTAPYFQALRDIVRNLGIKIPIIACPGDGKVSALGDTPDVVPFPNIYEWAHGGQPEEIVYDLLTDMHDPSKHGGIYNNVPTGSLEVNRSTQEVRRLLMGGADAYFTFNITGMIQMGQMNALTLGARAGDQAPHWGTSDEKNYDWIGTIFDFDDWNKVVNGFMSPMVGYMGGVLDYGGAISSSGVLRELYYQFRRDNLYFEAVEPWLARSERPNRSGSFRGADPSLHIDHDEIGTRQKAGMFHYWHDGGRGTALISLMNQSGKAQTIGLNAIQFRGESLPRYAPITVPIAMESRSFYDQILNWQLPLSPDFRLHYATSELLTFRPWNRETLVVLYGPEHSLGELKIDGKQLKLVHSDPGFQLHEADASSMLLSYPHRHGLSALLEDAAGARLRIFISDTVRSGSIWFLKQHEQDILIAGSDLVQPLDGDRLALDFDESAGEVLVMSPKEMKLEGLAPTQDFQTKSGIQRFARPGAVKWPKLPQLSQIRLKDDMQEMQPQYSTEDWISWQGDARSLDDLGIYRGHAYYRSEFLVPDLKLLKSDELFVQGASDIVGIYINGHYVTTVAPLGTEINSKSFTKSYRFGSIKPFLQKGRNTITFRTEIWGHGSFMFGQGHVAFTKGRLPALGYDAPKGLIGAAHIAGIPLKSWQVRAGLTGQIQDYAEVDLDDSTWTPGSAALLLGKGAVTWMRAQFKTADLPDAKAFDAPVVLHLAGFRSKATVYLNGQLLGRWLSDTEWLEQGSWSQPLIGMWVPLDPNDLPIPKELLLADGDNQLAIVFEDGSSDQNPPGFIREISLRYNQEGSLQTTRGLKYGFGGRQRLEISLREHQPQVPASANGVSSLGR